MALEALHSFSFGSVEHLRLFKMFMYANDLANAASK